MASCSSHLSEEQLLCSICLEVFTEPVSTSCGHNFCKTCIIQYWDSTDTCQCPMCNMTFDRRPNLLVNTFISEMAASFRKFVPVKAASSQDRYPVSQVSCDICIGKRCSALKSCLVCQTSFCETHLGPHLRVTSLMQHKLIDPVENLEARICEKHNRPLELFCTTDQTCVCQFCIETDHNPTHNIVTLEEDYGKQKAQIGMTGGQVQHLIRKRLRKVQSIKLSVEKSKRETKRAISDSVEVFTALVDSIGRSQAELVQAIEEKQKATEKRAEGFVKDLEQEIAELKRRSSTLEQLLYSKDHLYFLQTFPALSTHPHMKDWSEIKVHSDVGLVAGKVTRAVEDTLNKEMEKLPEVKLKRIQRWYAADVTLDPDTAHPKLILSDDGKQVRYRYGDAQKKNLPDNPQRFKGCSAVLGKQSISSGRFYYEVQVGGNAGWTLGVARTSINRKRKSSTDGGNWAVSRMDNGYWATNDVAVPISLTGKPQKVGVFVDYEGGQVSFYDVEAKCQIYTYIGCNFTETVHPYFNPHRSSTPLIITPVNHK